MAQDALRAQVEMELPRLEQEYKTLQENAKNLAKALEQQLGAIQYARHLLYGDGENGEIAEEVLADAPVVE